MYLIKEFERLKEIENQNREWNVSMITGIIKNKVYTGDLIQQKRKRISFKNIRLHRPTRPNNKRSKGICKKTYTKI